MHLGSIIPDFEALTTKGPIQFYKWMENSWCVLFSHPADFTPVCTSELGRVALHYHEFEKRNVKLIALSCDSLQDHINWIDDIKSYCSIKSKTASIPYPIISDEKAELAVKLDMINAKDIENEEIRMTVRALYIIDPSKKLRLTMVYPISTGRHIGEVLRVIDSLQLIDRINIIATPVNWQPGDKVMVLPNVEDKDVSKVFPNGVDTVAMPSGQNYLRSTADYKM